MVQKLPRWLSIFYLMHLIGFRSLWNNKSSWFAILLFATCLLLLFPFSLGTKSIALPTIQYGVYWAIAEFVAALSIGRIFFAEQEANALDILLCANASKSAIYLGKVSFQSIQMLSFCFPIFLLWFFLFNVSNVSWTFLNIHILFCISTAALGTLIACLTARSQGQEILQPMLFFPLQSGVLLATVSLSLGQLQEQQMGILDYQAWWSILIGYGLIFLSLGGMLSKKLFLS